MLNARINPFAAILAITVIASVGTLFVVHKISQTDYSYTGYAVVGGGTAAQITY